MRIDNPAQLAQLRIAYAQAEGALHVAQVAQQAAESAGQQYISQLGLVLGVEIPRSARISVDFTSGDVRIETAEQNGVAVPA
jgi:hypothetical protein